MADILQLTPEHYRKVLKRLRKEEEELGPNPLTKDWFRIRNKIRHIEKKLKEIENAKHR